MGQSLEHSRRAPRLTLAAIPDKLFENEESSGRLGPLLAWAVVFADIGTSIYYVPGLLFGELGGRTPSPAAAFVLATGLAFILLALKYVEVSARYPDGGGVVSVATDAFGPIVGCLGGILICVDYFLTGAISAVSGLQYLAAAVSRAGSLAGPRRPACAIVLLGLLNYVGVRESAILTAVLAIARSLVNVVVLVIVAVQLRRRASGGWCWISSVGGRGAAALAARWSASPAPGWPSRVWSRSARSRPRCASRARSTALRAMMLVMAAHPDHLAADDRARDRAARGVQRSTPIGSCSSWAPRSARGRCSSRIVADRRRRCCMGAANTAIIGCYHVFLALVRLGFLPPLAVRAQPPLQHAPPGHRRSRCWRRSRSSSPAAGTSACWATCTRSACWARSP